MSETCGIVLQIQKTTFDLHQEASSNAQTGKMRQYLKWCHTMQNVIAVTVIVRG